MSRLHDWAVQQPDKIAVCMAEGAPALTYAELDSRANRVAQWLLSLGFQAGDTIGLLLENHLRTFELWWGARRAGLYYVPISTHLTASEAAYILRDCGARVLVTSHAQRALAAALVASPADASLAPVDMPHRVMLDGVIAGYQSLEAALDAFTADVELPPRPVGREFMYSSGTTGFPKGIRRAQAPYEKRYDLPPLEIQLREIFRFGADTVYLSVTPLYHAVGRFNIRAIECGGTAVIMAKFDAEAALAAIERHHVTHTHWVPTMFVRVLALPEAVRQRYDVSSLRCAIHAAAPCAPHVKQAMIDWWGPVIEEYYGGSENLGVTYINARDWLTHRGSVGRAISGEMHIMSDEDHDVELPVGEIGMIYFGGGVEFRYHNDSGKTRSAFNARGWGTYGDLGHVDAEGYLYMSDRRTDLIISGGVNIYPREIEDVLVLHPAVADVAVIGVPDDEFGQQVRAVVQLRHADQASPDLAEALTAWCRARLSRIKCPRAIDFVDDLPRNDNGKLLKRVLRERYPG